jgi:hypothetical protein
MLMTRKWTPETQQEARKRQAARLMLKGRIEENVQEIETTATDTRQRAAISGKVEREILQHTTELRYLARRLT